MYVQYMLTTLPWWTTTNSGTELDTPEQNPNIQAQLPFILVFQQILATLLRDELPDASSCGVGLRK